LTATANPGKRSATAGGKVVRSRRRTGPRPVTLNPGGP
jgi:hypothetical protein